MTRQVRAGMTWRRFVVLLTGLSPGSVWWHQSKNEPVDDPDALAAALAEWNR